MTISYFFVRLTMISGLFTSGKMIFGTDRILAKYPHRNRSKVFCWAFGHSLVPFWLLSVIFLAIFLRKFLVDFLTCEFGSRGTKIRRLKVIVDILYKRLHNFSNFITDTTIGFCSSGLGQILLQILNPKSYK